MRDWKKFSDDEIYALWHSYMKTEFQGFDPLHNSPHFKQAIRLTPMEIIKLVDEILERLEIKRQKDNPLVPHFKV